MGSVNATDDSIESIESWSVDTGHSVRLRVFVQVDDNHLSMNHRQVNIFEHSTGTETRMAKQKTDRIISNGHRIRPKAKRHFK